MGSGPRISVVSPVYRAEGAVAELVGRLHENLAKITGDYEIILVNDASPDGSWDAIAAECGKDARVKGVNLSRNFGQHHAITGGLCLVKGDWVVVMDCDLQDRPDEIPNLYMKAQEGYDSVFARRVDRRDPLAKRLLSRAFYAVFSYMTDTKQDPAIANFGIYRREVIESVLAMGDHIRFFPTMVNWVGFRKAYLPVRHSERSEGKSSYNFKGLMRLAWDNIIAFSDKPLRLAIKTGFVISLFSLLLAAYNVVARLAGIIQAAGFTTIVFSIWFVGGLIMMMLGVVGLYVGRTFENVKKRPVFIIKDRINV